MFDRDLLCRAALYPKFAPHGTFDEAAFLNLHKVDDGRLYALSVASRFILRTIEGAHGYGCRSAGTANQGYEKTKGYAPDPDVDKVYYLGFYDLEYGHMRSLPLEFYDVVVRWVPENGEDAHFQLELHKNGKGETGKSADKKRRTDRAVAMAVLATFLTGPQHYFPNEDDGYPDDMSAEKLLPPLPRAAQELEIASV